MVDLARAQAHHALVDHAQQLDPPGGEQPADAVAVADVERVGRGEDFAFAHGGALAAVLGQRRGDGLKPFGEGFARVLHPDVRRREAAAPCGTLGDGARAQRPAAEPQQQAHHGDQNPGRASRGGERRREQPVGGVGRGAEEEARGSGRGRDGRPGEQPHEKDACERQGHRRDAEGVGLGRLGDLVGAGRAEEDRAVEFGEGQDDESADQRQCGQSGGGRQHVAARSDAVEHPEVDQQFGDEAVEGRQGADGRRAREEEDRRERHVLRKPAQRVERRGMGLREDVARAEKEQALEQRVVERVQQGARDAAQRDELVARGFAQRGDAESDEDDADVLDRGVGQQAFHVVLHGCEDHAPQARDDARREQDHSGGVQERLFAQRGRHAQDAVDARLDHHARHQGRDVRRGCGVRLRKPDVHREKSRLHAEARQEHQQQRQSRLRAEVVAQRAERGGAAGRVEPYEADDEQHEADVHHNQVGERRAPDFAPLGVEEDQQERRHGHQFPEKEEREAAVRKDHAQHGVEHRHQRRVVQRDVGRGFLGKAVGQIAPRVEHGGDGADRDDHDEQRRKPVHRAGVAAEKRTGDRPHGAAVRSGQHADGARRAPQGAGGREGQRSPDLAPQRRGENGRRHRRQGD